MLYNTLHSNLYSRLIFQSNIIKNTTKKNCYTTSNIPKVNIIHIILSPRADLLSRMRLQRRRRGRSEQLCAAPLRRRRRLNNQARRCTPAVCIKSESLSRRGLVWAAGPLARVGISLPMRRSMKYDEIFYCMK